MITFNTPSGISHVWNGSHTVQVFAPSGELIDAWTLFPSDGGKPTELDISQALAGRGEYLDCPMCGYFTLTDSVPDAFCDLCGISLWDDGAYARLAVRRTIARS